MNIHIALQANVINHAGSQLTNLVWILLACGGAVAILAGLFSHGNRSRLFQAVGVIVLAGVVLTHLKLLVDILVSLFQAVTGL